MSSMAKTAAGTNRKRMPGCMRSSNRDVSDIGSRQRLQDDGMIFLIA